MLFQKKDLIHLTAWNAIFFIILFKNIFHKQSNYVTENNMKKYFRLLYIYIYLSLYISIILVAGKPWLAIA